MNFKLIVGKWMELPSSVNLNLLCNELIHRSLNLKLWMDLQPENLTTLFQVPGSL